MATPNALQGRDAATLRAKFQNFDDAAAYEGLIGRALHVDTLNFVVLFGPDRAMIAIDLDENDFSALLTLNRLLFEDCPIRWINHWLPSKQRLAVNEIGKNYGFSARLRVTIMDRDEQVANAARSVRSAARKQRPIELPGKDLEEGYGLGRQSEQHEAPSPLIDDFESDDYALIKLWGSSLNYTSTDTDKRFICMGANWLYKHVQPPKVGKAQHSHDEASQTVVPPKHWYWLALCRDADPSPNTVLSFHESPRYESEDLRVREEELRAMRANVRRALAQISSIGKETYEKAVISKKAVRDSLPKLKASGAGSEGASQGVASVADIQSNGSCNLFYYLFEDYAAAVRLLNVCKENLDTLAARVVGPERKHPEIVSIVAELYRMSKDLRQLQHLSESYKNLVERILESTYVPKGKDAEDPMPEETQRTLPSSESHLHHRSARDRFERLRDRLQLLMLNKIKEYLDETASLSDTYFNVTAQKDSQATARLTRSATLLAKLSVFFLPIGFITSFFSVQLPGMLDGYTPNTYWGVFSVTLFISFLSLFFFSRMLMTITESLDNAWSRLTLWTETNMQSVFRRRGRGRGPSKDQG